MYSTLAKILQIRLQVWNERIFDPLNYGMSKFDSLTHRRVKIYSAKSGKVLIWLLIKGEQFFLILLGGLTSHSRHPLYILQWHTYIQTCKQDSLSEKPDKNLIKMANNIFIAFCFNDTHREKLCFTQFSTIIFWNRSWLLLTFLLCLYNQLSWLLLTFLLCLYNQLSSINSIITY